MIKTKKNPIADIKKIMIVDDHAIVRQGITLLIEQEDDMQVCCSTADSRSALTLYEKHLPQLAIIDITLKESDGLDLIKSLHLRHPQLLVLVLSMHDENIFAERALKAGAKGYIMKHEGTEVLIKAIRQILNGQIFVSERMNTRLLENSLLGKKNAYTQVEALLSDREFEIYRFVGNGLATKRIAAILNLSIKTIESHKEHIKKKLKINNSVELIHQATQWLAAN